MPDSEEIDATVIRSPVTPGASLGAAQASELGATAPPVAPSPAPSPVGTPLAVAAAVAFADPGPAATGPVRASLPSAGGASVRTPAAGRASPAAMEGPAR